MSALPPEADMVQDDRDIRFVPIAASAERIGMSAKCHKQTSFMNGSPVQDMGFTSIVKP